MVGDAIHRRKADLHRQPPGAGDSGTGCPSHQIRGMSRCGGASDGEEESGRNQPRSGQVRARSVDPREVWAQLQGGQVRLLDLRTEVERRRYGAPPGAIAVSLARHLVKPEGEGAVYLCQHAVRSKLTLRNGAVEVAGGFVAWQHAGLPVAKVQ